MAKRQLRYVIGKTYRVEGVSERSRDMKFVGRLKMGARRREHLVFRPLRKSSKFRSA
jgi:hypothetical protein